MGKGLAAVERFFYVFVANVADFALARAPHDPELGRQIRSDDEMTDWRPLHFVLEQGSIVTDYLANSFAFRLCSERLRDVIDQNKGIDDDVQWLPTTVEWPKGQQMSYWVLHFPTYPDVMNKTRTVTSGPVIVKAYLDPGLVRGHRVFSRPRDSVSLIVADSVRKAISRSGCSGMTFSKVPMA